MKLFALLVTVACLQASAEVYSQKISLSVKNTPIVQVFKELEKQSPYSFIYAKEQLGQMKPVDLYVVKADLFAVLKMLFKDQGFTYSISGKNIIVQEKPTNKAVEPPGQLQPLFIVTGKITDDQGKPLQGVSVVLKSSQKGVSTDAEGRFSIEVTQGSDVLIFSYVGFENKEQKVTASKDLTVTL
ncbi:MAG: carboxypeptidase-like regulatory domain-containing protein, partial [Gloeobacteraceae cyanobacterium ES-bin-316]|nr:carboxypeptidase-like regulatory domain-containing protein [Ferruginibacter sp.]